MTRVEDQFVVHGITILTLNEDMPHSDWRKVRIDGEMFDYIPAMDCGFNVLGIKGEHEFVGKEIQFV